MKKWVRNKAPYLLDPWFIAFLLITLLYILPVWIFKYFPSQDGPCHVYNAFILSHFNDPAYEFNHFYEIRETLIPNWTSHAFMAILMRMISPLIAEKIFLTYCIVFMAIALLYLLNAVEGKRNELVFLGFPFIYNGFFAMGFYNYSLGIALFLFTVGYWWKHITNLGPKNLCTLVLLLLLLYFSHPVALSLAILSLLIITVFSMPYRWIISMKGLYCLFCILFPLALLFCYMDGLSTDWSYGSWTLSRLWYFLIYNEALAYHSPNQLIISKILTGVFGLLILYTVIRDHFFSKDWGFDVHTNRKDLFIILAVSFFVIYLIVPDRLFGGTVIKARLSFVPFLIMIPSLNLDMPRTARTVVGISLILISIIYLIQTSYYHKILSDDLETYTSGFDVVKKNTVILPLTFDPIGKGWKICAFTHSAAHYGWARGCIDLGNYEAATDHFPTIFKPERKRPDIATLENSPEKLDFGKWANKIDYVISWALPSDSHVESRILKHYRPIKQNGDLKIFCRKTKTGIKIGDQGTNSEFFKD